jgi:hypothetical protein
VGGGPTERREAQSKKEERHLNESRARPGAGWLRVDHARPVVTLCEAWLPFSYLRPGHARRCGDAVDRAQDVGRTLRTLTLADFPLATLASSLRRWPAAESGRPRRRLLV